MIRRAPWNAILIAKYCDHIPLYRQAEIYARDGVDLDRGTLADWVGRLAWLVGPLADKIADHVMAGSVIHADDTPVPVLAPGNGLRELLTRIGEHPINKIDELLPWNMA